MHDEMNEVTGGGDTHSRVHVAAVVNAIGKILATASFAVNAAGYADLLAWMGSFGTLTAVGVEGTGSYGAGLCRFLVANNVAVIEVNRPNRQLRRRRGKSDSTDAESAARAVLNGEATGVPKTGDGNVEALRSLRIARRSAVKALTQASNQIRDLIVTAPDGLRDRLVDLSTPARIEVCARMRSGAPTEVGEATKRSLRCLARRRPPNHAQCRPDQPHHSRQPPQHLATPTLTTRTRTHTRHQPCNPIPNLAQHPKSRLTTIGASIPALLQLAQRGCLP